MISGMVKFFNNAKGFGFIQPDDGSKDAFVHISAVQRTGLATLSKNQKVSFELERRERQHLGDQSKGALIPQAANHAAAGEGHSG